jgi:hypothetical protein
MKVKLSVPSVDMITIGQYQEILSHYEVNGDNYQSDQFMVSVVYGMPVSEVKNIKKVELDEAIEAIKQVLAIDTELYLRVNIGGVEHGFIPNMDELSAGEYSDLETYLQSADTFHKAMAVMYRPIVKERGDKYLIAKYNGTNYTSDQMKDVPYSVFRSAMVFFWNLEKELLNASTSFMEAQTRKLILQQKGNTRKSGDGTRLLCELLAEISRISKEQQRLIFGSFSPSWNIHTMNKG